MNMTLHLMTQDGQPYGSQRKCCEICGTMLRGRPDSFWNDHAWTDDESEYKNCAVEHPEYVSCSDKKKESAK